MSAWQGLRGDQHSKAAATIATSVMEKQHSGVSALRRADAAWSVPPLLTPPPTKNVSSLYETQRAPGRALLEQATEPPRQEGQSSHRAEAHVPTARNLLTQPRCPPLCPRRRLRGWPTGSVPGPSPSLSFRSFGYCLGQRWGNGRGSEFLGPFNRRSLILHLSLCSWAGISCDTGFPRSRRKSHNPKSRCVLGAGRWLRWDAIRLLLEAVTCALLPGPNDECPRIWPDPVR